LRPVAHAKIKKVQMYLEKHGPVYTFKNVDQAARRMGMDGATLTRVLSIVRSPEWIEAYGWTIPYVNKGRGLKTYSVEHTRGETALLDEGNFRKAQETETHLRRSLAGLKLAARLATGVDQKKAQILATTAEIALRMVDEVVDEMAV
jgi:hypothetical protein